MKTYVIGDVQGCLDSLLLLLKTIEYNPEQDILWFTGDLASRGPKPLETLRFIKNLPASTVCVLGNHDLALLAAFKGIIELPPDESTRAILSAPDKDALENWLRHIPLLHHDKSLNVVMSHAGIYPYWTLQQAKEYALEAEKVLTSDLYAELLQTMYGNTPTVWENLLTGENRMRFILNAFTRMRFMTLDGKLDFETKGDPDNLTTLIPWFDAPNRKNIDENIVFGHWAALKGQCHHSGIYALDEGCVWGGCLTALCLETKKRFKVSC